MNAVTGTFPMNASISNLSLQPDHPVFTVEVELLPVNPGTKLTMLDDLPSIRPTLPGEIGTAINKAAIKITAKKDGLPAPGLKVDVDVKVDPYSNGHKHVTNPLNLSAFLAFPTIANQNPLTTDSNGQVQTVLTALEAAMDLTLIARATPSANGAPSQVTHTAISQPRQLRIGLPDLVPMGNVEKGQVPNPADYNISGIVSHNEGFYGTAATNQFLANTVSRLKELNDRSNGVIGCPLSNVLPLNIQGVSLRYGGQFDLEGDFLPPHGTHRVGQQVDIG